MLQQSFAACGSDGQGMCSVPRLVSNLSQRTIPGTRGLEEHTKILSDCMKSDVSEGGLFVVNPENRDKNRDNKMMHLHMERYH